MAKRRKIRAQLSRLESAVMRVLWQRGEARAEEVREAMAARHVLKESTVRTLLRRMEAKGVVEHRTEGRTYVYRPVVLPQHMAVDAARNIVERFCAGSTANLVLGMASDRMISPGELRRLADEIERARASGPADASRRAESTESTTSEKTSGRKPRSKKPHAKGE